MPRATMAESIRIIQWNCRSFSRKRAALQFALANFDPKIDVIALQETETLVKLTGYATYNELSSEQSKPRTAVAIQRNIAAEQVDLELPSLHYTCVRLLPKGKKQLPVIILNIYSPPKDKSIPFVTLLRKICREAGKSQIVVLGDLNAAHMVWGYDRNSRKGLTIMNAANRYEFSLITDSEQPTRIGNSISRNTTPDLCFVKNADGARWSNTELNLGSDHYMLTIDIPAKGDPKKRKFVTKHTKWDLFRFERNRKAPSSITDLGRWVRELIGDADKHTTEIPFEENGPKPDSKLINLWEQQQTLQAEWLKNKHNRQLKLRLAGLDQEIQDYSTLLSSSQWYQICDRINGQLGSKNPWTLLKHLLDPDQSKGASQEKMLKILHSFPGGEKPMMDLLCSTYLNTKMDSDSYEPYKGAPNADLDQDFTAAEVRAALASLRSTSAAGNDRVTNKMLRNLDGVSIDAITKLFNDYWHDGSIPPEWKDAKVIFIPKPGKPLKLENLRPISITSCLGKAMEHVVLSRLVEFTETKQLFPATMVGFRPNVSAQDILWQLQRDILDPGIPGVTRTILGLDIKKAFDNVAHRAILEGLSALGVGDRTHTYIKAFLRDRTATLHFGTACSDKITLGTCGTPQGAVLSPFLFNVAMYPLARKLSAIPHIRHAIYADDVTIWTRTGSSDEVVEALQRAADEVQRHARKNGLECSPAKSELFLMCRKLPNSIDKYKILIDGAQVPIVPTIRVLGLHIQEKAQNSVTLSKLRTTVQQLSNMLRRVTNRNQGVKESEACRLVQAFFIGRLAYTCPYLYLRKSDLKILNTMIRTVYKTALGIPKGTSSLRLLDLGVHNTIEEIIEAHKAAQLWRLSCSAQGHKILEAMNLRPVAGITDRIRIPNSIRNKIIIPPFPKTWEKTM